jgi:hypothetical protein
MLAHIIPTEKTSARPIFDFLDTRNRKMLAMGSVKTITSENRPKIRGIATWIVDVALHWP